MKSISTDFSDQVLDIVADSECSDDRAKAFVLRHVAPANRATEYAVEAVRVSLGCQNRDGHKRAICGFLQACKALSDADVKTLAFPSAKSVYVDDGGSYQAFMSVKNKLISGGWIVHERKAAADHGRARIFRLAKSPDTEGLEFTETATTHVLRLNRKKLKSAEDYSNEENEKLQPIRRKDLLTKFGIDLIEREEERVKSIVSYLSDYPLHLGGTEFRSLWRIFNNGSLELGGRLYAGYSGLPKGLRSSATIDGEPICQVDIKASYLCVRAGMSGASFEEGSDPYQLVPWVDSSHDRTREMAKQLISALISCGGDKRSFPKGMRGEFSDIISKKETIKDYRDPIHEVFPFLLEEVDGLAVMYQESEIMMAVLERCVKADLPAWPLHDCLFVRESDHLKAVSFIKDVFSTMLGFRPTMTVTAKDFLKYYV
jgi:hypothetical protein